MTTVINIRKKYLKQLGYADLQQWLKDPNHVYIGRDMTHYVPGAKASKWANPFTIKKYGIDKCLEMYHQYLLNNPQLLSSLNELRGKVLGCWCVEPDNYKCHGLILKKLIDDSN